MTINKAQQHQLYQLADQFGLSLVLLFGSQAQGRITPLSDIDIAVLSVRNKSLDTYDKLRLTGAFQELFKSNQVDVVLLNRAGPLLRYEALTKGVILLDRDPAYHAAIHLQALRDYEDTKHFRAVQFAAMSKHLQAGTFGKPL